MGPTTDQWPEEANRAVNAAARWLAAQEEYHAAFAEYLEATNESPLLERDSEGRVSEEAARLAIPSVPAPPAPPAEGGPHWARTDDRELAHDIALYQPDWHDDGRPVMKQSPADPSIEGARWMECARCGEWFGNARSVHRRIHGECPCGCGAGPCCACLQDDEPALTDREAAVVSAAAAFSQLELPLASNGELR